MHTRPRLADFVRAHRLSREGHTFDAIADRLLHSVRQAMGVPKSAEPDIEAEFLYLRRCLEDFRPEYEAIFGSLLWKHLGDGVEETLHSVEQTSVQEYLSERRAFRKAFAPEQQRIEAKLRAVFGEEAPK